MALRNAFENVATDSKLEQVRAVLTDGSQTTKLHPDTLAALESVSVTVANPTDTSGLATQATLEALRVLVAALNPLTDAQLRANPVPVDVGANLSVTASFQSQISTLNNLDTPLAAGEVFEGGWEDARDFAAISVVIDTDQPSAINGAVIQFSEDAATVIRSVASTIPSGGGHFVLAPQARYFRVRYTNGATPQTRLRSEITLRFNAPSLVQQPLAAPITDANMAGIVKAHLAGRLSTGQWASIKVNSDGTLTADPAIASAINAAEAARAADATTAQTRLDLLASEAKLEQVRSELAAAETARDADATAAQTRLDLLATEAKLEQVRAAVAAAETARDTDATAAQTRLDLLATEATLEALLASITAGVKTKRLTGGGYASGTGATTVNVPAGKVIEKVSCAASQIQDITLTVGAGNPAVTVKAGMSFEDAFCGLGTGLAVTFAGGVDSYFVRWADA